MSRLWTTSLVVSVVAVATSASNAVLIGPWPVDAMWQNQPIAGYVAGSTTISGSPAMLNQPAPTSAAKTSWLPYGGTYSEKMAIAHLQLDPDEMVTSVHAKIYDPATTGKSGWAVIFQDEAGKIFDFGIRGHIAVGQIVPRQYDGAAWTNGPASSRARTGNNYYTMDFTQNANGTISYSIAGWENGGTWNYANTTTVSYGNLTGIYLSTSTPDTSGAASYKWTEFTYAPEPGTLALLGLGGLFLRRRTA